MSAGVSISICQSRCRWAGWSRGECREGRQGSVPRSRICCRGEDHTEVQPSHRDEPFPLSVRLSPVGGEISQLGIRMFAAGHPRGCESRVAGNSLSICCPRRVSRTSARIDPARPPVYGPVYTTAISGDETERERIVQPPFASVISIIDSTRFKTPCVDSLACVRDPLSLLYPVNPRRPHTHPRVDTIFFSLSFSLVLRFCDPTLTDPRGTIVTLGICGCRRCHWRFVGLAVVHGVHLSTSVRRAAGSSKKQWDHSSVES